MDSIIKRAFSPFAAAWRVIVLTLIICATGQAWAVVPTPTAVWDRNFVDNSVTRGEDGYDYTFTLNDPDNTVSDGILKIGSTNKRGALISIGDSTASKVSVLVKYAFAKAPTASALPLVIYTERGSSANSPDVGLVSSGGASTTLWPCWVVKSGSVDYNNVNVGNLNRQSGYMLLSYDCSTLKCYVGSSIASLSGITQAYTWAGKVTHVGLGGPTGKAHDTSGTNNDHYPAWNGLVIEKVALFVGESYSNTDVSEYIFPGEATYYSQWDYANDIITWTTGSSNDKDMGGNATYALFDKNTGTDTSTVYTGGSTEPAYGTSNQKFWYNLCYGSDSTSYKTPGLVLRVANNLATLSMGGTFGPLTLGGMIVEPGAHNNALETYKMEQDQNNSNRSTIFGDPTGKTETLFDFNESFAINRGGAFCFSGKVNLNIHTSKSLTLSQSAKVCGNLTDISNNGIIEESMIHAGGVLKMHGNGTLVPSAGLDASGASLDFSDLAGRANDTPFINGAITIDASTTLILPAGATSPYKVATAISGTYPTSITIGDKTYAASVSAGENAGEIAWEINEYTIDAAGDYVLSTIFPTPASTKDYTVFVKADATLDIGSAEVRSIMFDVAEGKTLTLSGTSLLATTIYVTGKGVVKATANNALSGKIKGDGTLLYQYGSTASDAIPAGLTLTDSAWTGTLWLKNMGLTSTGTGTTKTGICLGATNGTAAENPVSLLGNSGSKVKFTNVRAHVYTVACPWTLVLEDDGDNYAWYNNNGWAAQTATFAALAGDGTLFDEYTGAGDKCMQQLIFTGVSGFTGHIAVNGKRIGFGGSTTAESGNAGIIHVNSGNLTATPTFKANKYYVASGATLNFAGGTIATEFVNIVGTININSDATLTVTSASQDKLNYGGTGTVNVRGTLAMTNCRWTIGSSNVINLYQNGTISGTGQLTYGALDWYQPGTLNVYGTSTISANIRCRDNGNLTFNVESGTCTFSGESYGARPITKTGAGILKIAYTGSSEYNLPSVSEGTIEFASGTWNFGTARSLSGYTVDDEGTAVIKVEQTQSEYGNGETVVSDVDESIESITIVRPDGTSTTVTPSSGTATLSEAVVVSGAACWHAYEMNKSIGEGQYQTRIADSGTGNVPLQLYYSDFADSNFTQEGDSDNWYLKYNEKQPYPTSGYNLGTEWTAAIRCTVPTANKGIVVAFGTQSGGLIGLAAGETAGEVIIVRTTGNSQYTKLATMTVAHPTEAQHVYVFTKTADAVTVYCDGDFINRTTVSFTSPSNFQIGSVHGGMDNTGLVGANSGEMDYLRIYNFAITPKMIAKLASDNPYVSSSGTYTRTVTGDDNWVDDDAWTVTVNYTASTTDAPASDAVAMLTVNGASTMTINLSSAALYEELTFDGSAAVRLEAGDGTAKLSAVKVDVETDVTVAYGAADFSTTRVSVADGKTLTFDFSAEPINSQTERQVVYLTGVTATPADLSDSSTWPVQVTTHSDAASLSTGFLSRFEYDTDSLRYVYTYGPNHTVGGEVYYTGGYWSSDANNTISVTNSYGEATIVFSGDTVVIPAYYPGDTPVIYSDTTLPANVSYIRVSKSKIKMCSGVDSGDIFTGSTWTIDSGCTLWFGVANNHPTSLGAMTINGSGTVECGDITINGAISGNAPVKILDNVTTRLTSTGSIATAHTISGGSSATITVAKTTPISERMAFGTWTGTVVLPENFNASNGVDLHYYGKEGSTIEINGFSGWLTTGETYWGAGTYGRQIKPHLKLNGNMSITGLSAAWYDIIGGISGSGNFSLSSDNKPNGDSFWITKVSGYTGSIINNTTGSAETTIVIKELVADTFVGGTKILSRGGTGPLRVSKVTFADTEQSLSDLCYESDGVYVAAAEYDSVNYYSVAAAIAEAGDENLADITLLNGCTTVPDGYYIEGETIAKYPAAIVYAEGDPDYYTTAQAAVNAANFKTYQSQPYEYVALYADAAVTTTMTLKIKPINDVVVTVTVPGITSEYALNNETDEDGVTTYTIDPAPTDYAWSGESGVWNISAVAPWRYGADTQATRAPSSVDTVVFASDAAVTVGENISVSSISVSSAITLTKASTDVTVTAATGGIVLTDRDATITVSGVTLSPAPTTNVGGGAKVILDGNTYKVVYGTIFSVY